MVVVVDRASATLLLAERWQTKVNRLILRPERGPSGKGLSR